MKNDDSENSVGGAGESVGGGAPDSMPGVAATAPDQASTTTDKPSPVVRQHSALQQVTVLGNSRIISSGLAGRSTTPILILWDSQNGNAIASTEDVLVAVSQNTRFLTESSNKAWHVWDGIAGTVITILAVPDSFGRAAGAHWLDSGKLLTSYENGALRLWDGESFEPISSMHGHQSAVSGAIGVDDDQILSWSTDGNLRLWEADSGVPLALMQGHSGTINGAATLPHGDLLSWGSDNTLRIWARKNGALREVLPVQGPGIRKIEILRNSWVIASTSDGTLKIWDSRSGALLFNVEADGFHIRPNGDIVSFSHQIQIWCGNTLAKKDSIVSGHTQAIVGVAECGEDRIATWALDASLHLWDIKYAQAPIVLQGHLGLVKGVCALDNGRIFGWSSDKTVKVWDSRSGAPLMELKGHLEEVQGAEVLPDGRILTWSVDTTIRIRDGENGYPLQVLGAPRRIATVAMAHGTGATRHQPPAVPAPAASSVPPAGDKPLYGPSSARESADHSLAIVAISIFFVVAWILIAILTQQHATVTDGAATEAPAAVPADAAPAEEAPAAAPADPAPVPVPPALDPRASGTPVPPTMVSLGTVSPQTNPNEQLLYTVAEGDLNANGQFRRTLTLPANSQLVFRGECDSDCRDLDLTLTNTAGRVIERDVESNVTPAIGVRTESIAAPASLLITMVGCAVQPCHYQVKMYRRLLDQPIPRAQIPNPPSSLRPAAVAPAPPPPPAEAPAPRPMQGETFVATVGRNNLRSGETSTLSVAVPSNSPWVFRGTCSPSCSDLDMTVLDASGNTIGNDEYNDAIPAVAVPPQAGTTANIKVRVKMVSCSTPLCAFRVDLFRKSGEPLAPAAAPAEAPAPRAAEGETFVATVGRNSLRPGETSTLSVDVPGNSSLVFRGTCSPSCSDLDMTVLDASGNTVGRDQDNDAIPAVAVNTRGATAVTVRVRVKMVSCSTPLCAFRVDLLSKGDLPPTPAVAPTASQSVSSPKAKLILNAERSATLDSYYTEELRGRELEGRVDLSVCVGDNGKVRGNPIVTSSSGHQELDAAAVQWARKSWWRRPEGTPPGELCNQPLAVTFRLPPP